jgi:adenylosuccinate lyase
MNDLLKGLYVDANRMKQNLELSMGQTFSSHVLLALVDKGLSREDAYKMVQSASHSLKKNENLMKSLMRDKEVSKYLKSPELKVIFSGKKHIQAILERFKVLNRELKTNEWLA